MPPTEQLPNPPASYSRTEDDQVGERDPGTAGLQAVELVPDLLQNLQRSCQLGWVVDLPVSCGSRRIRAPLAPPRMAVLRKLAGDTQAVKASWEMMDSPDDRSLHFRAAMSASVIRPDRDLAVARTLFYALGTLTPSQLGSSRTSH